MKLSMTRSFQYAVNSGDAPAPASGRGTCIILSLNVGSTVQYCIQPALTSEGVRGCLQRESNIASYCTLYENTPLGVNHLVMGDVNTSIVSSSHRQIVTRIIRILGCSISMMLTSLLWTPALL